MKIRLQDLTKQYGSTTALHHLNLDIHDGEFLVILGSSGSGKSTTLNMLAGLEAPTSGYIFFHERMVNHVPSGRRDVALVFQNYALYPHMKVYDNIPVVESALHNVQIRPNAPYYQWISDILQKHVNKILLNQTSSEEALMAMKAKLEGVKRDFAKN